MPLFGNLQHRFFILLYTWLDSQSKKKSWDQWFLANRRTWHSTLKERVKMTVRCSRFDFQFFCITTLQCRNKSFLKGYLVGFKLWLNYVKPVKGEYIKVCPSVSMLCIMWFSTQHSHLFSCVFSFRRELCRI